MTKHANKNTNVKGFYLDANNNFDKIAFEVETSYTRSIEKAREFAAEKIEIAAQFVVVTEINNEIAKSFNWLVPDIQGDAFILYYDEQQAKEVATDFDTVAKFFTYDYQADVFGYRDEKPVAEHILVSNKAFKATKGNARAIVKEYAIEVCGFDSVVYVGQCVVDEYKTFAVIPNDVVESYKKYVEK